MSCRQQTRSASMPKQTGTVTGDGRRMGVVRARQRSMQNACMVRITSVLTRLQEVGLRSTRTTAPHNCASVCCSRIGSYDTAHYLIFTRIPHRRNSPKKRRPVIIQQWQRPSLPQETLWRVWRESSQCYRTRQTQNDKEEQAERTNSACKRFKKILA